MALKAEISRTISVLGHIIASCLSYLVPKKKDYWVFVSFQFYGKYSGNNKALFEYIHKNHGLIGHNKKVVYVTNNKRTEKHIQDLGLPVEYNRLFWLFPLLRAELIFVDGVRRFMGFGKFRYVQLWHGTGFKSIAFTFTGAKNSRLQNYLLQKFSDNSLIICATSEEDRTLMELAFNSKNVKITGTPRNDLFFTDKKLAPNSKKKILYAPTFRDTGGKFSAMNSDSWDRIQNLMEDINADFIVKKHPSDFKLTIPVNKKNIIDVTAETEDIQTLLNSVDVLITDYSAISTDFSITGKPIIFFMYDYEKYISSNRTLYYEIKEVTPGPFAYTTEELMGYLENFDWFYNSVYQKKYDEFKNRFHQYSDGNSSKRVLQEVLKIKYI